ncbi:NUDIX domain-containing protein [Kitasatospora purpeofusca]|uniref:NUDIX domain-containing protein n=1 Tax=Kitasatospora purpeofusca TaxID=67352 RepID=UPI00380C8B78
MLLVRGGGVEGGAAAAGVVDFEAQAVADDGDADFDEAVGGRAVRETREETGIDIEITGIVGTCTDPRHVFAYDDGEVRQEFSICLLGRPLGGELRVSDESHEVAWFTPAETDGLPMVSNIRRRLADWRSGKIPVVR